MCETVTQDERDKKFDSAVKRSVLSCDVCDARLMWKQLAASAAAAAANVRDSASAVASDLLLVDSEDEACNRYLMPFY